MDAGALVRDTRACWLAHSKAKDPPPLLQGFDAAGVTIEVDGDRATAEMPGASNALVLVHRAGRWYLDLASMP